MKYEYVIYDCGHEYYRTEARLVYESSKARVYEYNLFGGDTAVCITGLGFHTDRLNPNGTIEVFEDTISAHDYLINRLSDDHADQAYDILEKLGVDPEKQVEVE